MTKTSAERRDSTVRRGRGDGLAHNESVHDLIVHGRAICIRGVNYYFGTGETPVAGPVRQQAGYRPRRGRDHDRAVGLGQDDAADPDRRPAVGTEGSILVNGRELVGASRQALVAHRRQIGFIFQHHNLFSSLSAVENVRMATALQPGARHGDARAAPPRSSNGSGWATGATITPARLSGGQRQRVAIARALVNRPQLVLADEPTAALDAESGATVMDLLRELADGPERTTVLIVTHDQRLLDHADRIVNMVGGRIVSSVMPAMTIRILKTISQLKELQGLSEATLTRIADEMTVEHRRPGEIVAREGTPGHKVCVIGEGTAEALKDDVVQRELDPGDYYGAFTAMIRPPDPRDRPRQDRPRGLLPLQGRLPQGHGDRQGLRAAHPALYMTRQ